MRLCGGEACSPARFHLYRPPLQDVPPFPGRHGHEPGCGHTRPTLFQEFRDVWPPAWAGSLGLGTQGRVCLSGPHFSKGGHAGRPSGFCRRASLDFKPGYDTTWRNPPSRSPPPVKTSNRSSPRAIPTIPPPKAASSRAASSRSRTTSRSSTSASRPKARSPSRNSPSRAR